MCIKDAVAVDFMLLFDGYAWIGTQLFNSLIINNFNAPIMPAKQANHIVFI